MNRHLVWILTALIALSPAAGLLAADDEHKQPGLVDPILSTFWWSVITFLVVLFALKKLAWAPLLKALDEREARIKESLQAADLARAESDRLKEEHEQLMAEARKEATAIVEEGKRDATVVKDGIVADAKRESEALTSRAKSEIERAKDVAVEEIHQRAVDLSYAITEKLIGKSLNPDEHKALVERTIKDYSDMSN